MANKKALRIPNDMFYRDYDMEQEFGVDDIKLYGYWESDNHLAIVGQIVADSLSKEFSLVCSVYDKDGDVIESSDNESYGGSGFVTRNIKPDSFFNGFPFRFSIYGIKKNSVKEIRVVLTE